MGKTAGRFVGVAAVAVMGSMAGMTRMPVADVTGMPVAQVTGVPGTTGIAVMSEAEQRHGCEPGDPECETKPIWAHMSS
jgi:hypothetical protein